MSTEHKAAYVVGVDHRIQYTNANCGPEWRSDIHQFEDYLVEQARKLDVDLLGEEFSEEQVQQNHATGCTVRDAARRADRRHLFLDPDREERVAAGILTSEQREQEWLRRLRGADARRLIVVCGEDHVDSFAVKLGHAGFRTTVLGRKWGNNWRFRN